MKIHKFSKIHITYIYVYTSFCAMIDKGLRENKRKKGGEIGKPKLNEMEHWVWNRKSETN